LSEIHFRRPESRPLEIEFVPRPAVVRYQQWVKEQGLDHVARRLPADLPLVSGNANRVRLQVANSAAEPVQGELRVEAPNGWQIEPVRQGIQVRPNGKTDIDVSVVPPAGARTDVDLVATLRANGQSTSAIAKGHPLPFARVVRIKATPLLDGTDHTWEGAPPLSIAPTDIVQGKASDETDSSAVFRLAHDGTHLWIDIQVRDNIVVTNIAPNDIKGHWRSDSIEICLDPAGGAEDTLGCYKLGIFPFDT